LRLIHPCHFAVRFDSVTVVQKPETNRPIPLNGINGVKAKPTVRNVQHDSAIIRVEVDIGEPIHCGPWSFAAFWIRRWRYHLSNLQPWPAHGHNVSSATDMLK
jgi:hypothetical protein